MWPFSKAQKFSVISGEWKGSEKKNNILRKTDRGVKDIMLTKKIQSWIVLYYFAVKNFQ